MVVASRPPDAALDLLSSLCLASNYIPEITRWFLELVDGDDLADGAGAALVRIEAVGAVGQSL